MFASASNARRSASNARRSASKLAPTRDRNPIAGVCAPPSCEVAGYPYAQSVTKTFFRYLLPFLALGLTLAAAAGPWQTDLEQAKQQAARENKPLLVDFTGSTWCPPCQALDAEVLNTDAFASWSRNYILVKLDFPPARERTEEKVRSNPELQQLMRLKDEYSVRGFPTVIIVEPNGNERARVVGYSRGQGPAAYLRQLK
jgi:protein disulfide-isomerase